MMVKKWTTFAKGLLDFRPKSICTASPWNRNATWNRTAVVARVNRSLPQRVKHVWRRVWKSDDDDAKRRRDEKEKTDPKKVSHDWSHSHREYFCRRKNAKNARKRTKTQEIAVSAPKFGRRQHSCFRYDATNSKHTTIFLFWFGESAVREGGETVLENGSFTGKCFYFNQGQY